MNFITSISQRFYIDIKQIPMVSQTFQNIFFPELLLITLPEECLILEIKHLSVSFLLSPKETIGN